MMNPLTVLYLKYQNWFNIKLILLALSVMLILHFWNIIQLDQLIDKNIFYVIENVDFVQSTGSIDIKYPIISILLFVVSLKYLTKFNNPLVALSLLSSLIYSILKLMFTKALNFWFIKIIFSLNDILINAILLESIEKFKSNCLLKIINVDMLKLENINISLEEKLKFKNASDVQNWFGNYIESSVKLEEFSYFEQIYNYVYLRMVMPSASTLMFGCGAMFIGYILYKWLLPPIDGESLSKWMIDNHRVMSQFKDNSKSINDDLVTINKLILDNSGDIIKNSNHLSKIGYIIIEHHKILISIAQHFRTAKTRGLWDDPTILKLLDLI